MTYTITLQTSDYRGDHAADVAVSVDVREGETVAQLVERCLNTSRRGVEYDRVELRLVQVIGAVPGAPTPPVPDEPPF